MLNVGECLEFRGQDMEIQGFGGENEAGEELVTLRDNEGNVHVFTVNEVVG